MTWTRDNLYDAWRSREDRSADIADFAVRHLNKGAAFAAAVPAMLDALAGAEEALETMPHNSVRVMALRLVNEAIAKYAVELAKGEFS